MHTQTSSSISIRRSMLCPQFVLQCPVGCSSIAVPEVCAVRHILSNGNGGRDYYCVYSCGCGCHSGGCSRSCKWVRLTLALRLTVLRVYFACIFQEHVHGPTPPPPTDRCRGIDVVGGDIAADGPPGGNDRLRSHPIASDRIPSTAERGGWGVGPWTGLRLLCMRASQEPTVIEL